MFLPSILLALQKYSSASWWKWKYPASSGASSEQTGIDPCGERGEYHTVVPAGPLFSASFMFHRVKGFRRRVFSRPSLAFVKCSASRP